MASKPLRKKWWFVTVLAVLGAASLAAGGYYTWLRTPPPLPETVEEAIETLKGDRFTRMPESRKQPYYEKSAELWQGLEGDARRQLRDMVREDPNARKAMGDMMRNMITERARKYATSTPEERVAMLDAVIAMQEMGAQRRQQRRESGNAERRERPEGDQPVSEQEREERRERRRTERRERMEQWIEHGNPQRQAYLGEFFKALRERREERGLDPDAGFGRRGRGRGR